MSVALTRYRALNALRCYTSYALNRLGSALPFLHLTPSTLHHSPLFVSVEPANMCQLKCPECPVGQGRNKRGKEKGERFMSHSVWQRVLSEVQETAHTIQFYFQGEPLLNKDLPQMIREAHDAGLYTIVSTNAQAMTAEMANALVQAGLDRIIISMDGLSDSSYKAYRVGGSLDKTKSALQYIREAMDAKRSRSLPFWVGLGSPIIELQCLRLRTNEHEWAQFKREYRSLGADRLVFKTAQLSDYENGHPLMPSDPRYSRYIQGTDGKYHRRRLRKGCFRVWSGCVITTDGTVLPCCYDKAQQHAYGNIMTTPLRELFTSPRAQAFRQDAFHETPQICQECWR